MFDRFTLMQEEAAPLGSLPPPEWKEKGGRMAIERVRPASLLTLICKVSGLRNSSDNLVNVHCSGREECGSKCGLRSRRMWCILVH